MTELEEILDTIFEALPDTMSGDFFGVTPRLPEPELYINVNGKCWRIRAEHHPHQIRCEDEL